MTHLVNQPARRRRVFELHGLSDPGESHAPRDITLLAVEPDWALHQGDLDGAGAFRVGSLIRHGPAYLRPAVSSESSLPRYRAIVAGSFSESRPATVARTTL